MITSVPIFVPVGNTQSGVPPSSADSKYPKLITPPAVFTFAAVIVRVQFVKAAVVPRVPVPEPPASVVVIPAPDRLTRTSLPHELTATLGVKPPSMVILPDVTVAPAGSAGSVTEAKVVPGLADCVGADAMLKGKLMVPVTFGQLPTALNSGAVLPWQTTPLFAPVNGIFSTRVVAVAVQPLPSVTCTV